MIMMNRSVIRKQMNLVSNEFFYVIKFYVDRIFYHLLVMRLLVFFFFACAFTSKIQLLFLYPCTVNCIHSPTCKRQILSYLPP